MSRVSVLPQHPPAPPSRFSVSRLLRKKSQMTTAPLNVLRIRIVAAAPVLQVGVRRAASQPETVARAVLGLGPGIGSFVLVSTAAETLFDLGTGRNGYAVGTDDSHRDNAKCCRGRTVSCGGVIFQGSLGTASVTGLAGTHHGITIDGVGDTDTDSAPPSDGFGSFPQPWAAIAAPVQTPFVSAGVGAVRAPRRSALYSDGFATDMMRSGAKERTISPPSTLLSNMPFILKILIPPLIVAAAPTVSSLAVDLSPRTSPGPGGVLKVCDDACFIGTCGLLPFAEGDCQNLNNKVRSWRPPKDWLCHMFESSDCQATGNVEVGLYPGNSRETDSIQSFQCHYVQGLSDVPTYTTTCHPSGVPTSVSASHSLDTSTPTVPGSSSGSTTTTSDSSDTSSNINSTPTPSSSGAPTIPSSSSDTLNISSTPIIPVSGSDTPSISSTPPTPSSSINPTPASSSTETPTADSTTSTTSSTTTSTTTTTSSSTDTSTTTSSSTEPPPPSTSTITTTSISTETPAAPTTSSSVDVFHKQCPESEKMGLTGTCPH
ncbi:hypothetical protein DFH06DRAFT_1483343 [Mycena polygramma]|nr:hypothetical protein DFH06DRAFT_1483343 [Mycena polygramma]